MWTTNTSPDTHFHPAWMEIVLLKFPVGPHDGNLNWPYAETPPLAASTLILI